MTKSYRNFFLFCPWVPINICSQFFPFCWIFLQKKDEMYWICTAAMGCKWLLRVLKTQPSTSIYIMNIFVSFYLFIYTGKQKKELKKKCSILKCSFFTKTQKAKKLAEQQTIMCYCFFCIILLFVFFVFSLDKKRGEFKIQNCKW